MKWKTAAELAGMEFLRGRGAAAHNPPIQQVSLAASLAWPTAFFHSSFISIKEVDWMKWREWKRSSAGSLSARMKPIALLIHSFSWCRNALHSFFLFFELPIRKSSSLRKEKEWLGCGSYIGPCSSRLTQRNVNWFHSSTKIDSFHQIDCCLRYHRGSWCQYTNYCYNIFLFYSPAHKTKRKEIYFISFGWVAGLPLHSAALVAGCGLWNEEPNPPTPTKPFKFIYSRKTKQLSSSLH